MSRHLAYLRRAGLVSSRKDGLWAHYRLEAPSDHSAPPGRKADLLARWAFVEGLSDWPLDVPTLGRFALYLLIPLGSWLGGALVERVVNQVMD